MKHRKLILIVAAAVLAIYVLMMYRKSMDASVLLVNGVVYTVNDVQPLAEAIALQGDRIVGVGSTEEITAAFTAERIIDLKGKAVYPGFIDAHGHIENLGALLLNVNLAGTNSVEEVQALVARRIKTSEGPVWVRGRGWDQNRWPEKSFPTREMLDSVSVDVPIYLTRIDGHAVWVNSRVLGIAGITKSTPDPEGGRILRDGRGNPTGVFVDNAVDSLDRLLPSPSREERTEAIEKAVQECIRTGLTQVHDMGVDLEEISIFKELIEAGGFPLRVYAAIGGLGKTWEHYVQHGPEIGLYNGRLTVRSLKLYADGALGSRGAALIEPYSDDPGNRGLTLTSAEVLNREAARALDRGFQVCIHAIGDRANHIALNVYEECFKTDQQKAHAARFRVEHVQVLDSQDVHRFHDIGVIASFQPTHCTSDMYWAEDRVGSVRVKGAYAWRSLLEQGSAVAGGSDFPIESPNPLWGFYAAITRQDHSGWPDGGWYPGQRLTREEALKLFTTWASFAAFEEHTKGSLEAGKVADIVVLSDDIMKIEPRRILQTTVELTFVAGQVVYSSGVLVASGVP